MLSFCRALVDHRELNRELNRELSRTSSTHGPMEFAIKFSMKFTERSFQFTTKLGLGAWGAYIANGFAMLNPCRTLIGSRRGLGQGLRQGAYCLRANSATACCRCGLANVAAVSRPQFSGRHATFPRKIPCSGERSYGLRCLWPHIDSFLSVYATACDWFVVTAFMRSFAFWLCRCEAAWSAASIVILTGSRRAPTEMAIEITTEMHRRSPSFRSVGRPDPRGHDPEHPTPSADNRSSYAHHT